MTAIIVALVLGLICGVLFHWVTAFLGFPAGNRIVALIVGFCVGASIPFCAMSLGG